GKTDRHHIEAIERIQRNGQRHHQVLQAGHVGLVEYLAWIAVHGSPFLLFIVATRSRGTANCPAGVSKPPRRPPATALPRPGGDAAVPASVPGVRGHTCASGSTASTGARQSADCCGSAG